MNHWKQTRFKTILVIDVTGKAHTFSFAPYATITDLRSQINAKFQLTSDLYWLSCCGKPFHDFVPLEEITGTVIMNGRLNGGIQCCLKGCDNEAGSRKFNSMIGRYEINVPHNKWMLKILRIIECVINIMAVYLPEDISLQREKAHQGHAVMLREAFLRQHRPLLHVHNATIQSVLPVTSPARNIT